MSDFRVYLGCYFELPKKVDSHEWDEFVSKYASENFSYFTLVDDRKVIYNAHNKFTHYFDDISNNFPVEINEKTVALAQIYFAAESKQLFETLKKDYGIIPEILYGVIPYYC